MASEANDEETKGQDDVDQAQVMWQGFPGSCFMAPPALFPPAGTVNLLVKRRVLRRSPFASQMCGLGQLT